MKTRYYVLATGLVVLCIAGTWFFWPVPTQVQLTVQQARWQHKIPLQDFGPRPRESKFKTATDPGVQGLPEGAYNVTSQKNVTIGTEQVYGPYYGWDFEEGGMKRKTGWHDEDVKGTIYRYTIDDWAPTDPFVESGEGKSPNYTDYVPPNPEKIRIAGAAQKTFYVDFTYEVDGEIFETSRAFEQDVWEDIQGRYDAFVDSKGKILAMAGVDPEFAKLNQ